MPRRLAALTAFMLMLFVICGCGQPRVRGAHWSTQLPWGRGVTVGWEDGAQIGPLSGALSPNALVVADSFARRVLLWQRGRQGWEGPVPLEVPAAAPLVAVGVNSAGSVIVADADADVWSLSPGVTAKLLADLHPAAGDFRRVLSVAALQGGAAVAEVVDVTAERSSRELIRIERGQPPRPVLTAGLAWADPRPDATDVQRMSPTGLRSTLAAAASEGVWIAVRGPTGGGGEIWRVGATGRVEQRRPLPRAMSPPGDFLGVDQAGRGYVLAAAGTPNARLLVFDGSARAQQGVRILSGDGPRLPHPVSVSVDGSLLVMTAQAQGLRLDWWPAGRLPRSA